MIKTATQLKALIRNQSKGDSGKAQLLMRNYAMERFLERVSVSEYCDNFILKGGMLVAAIVGLDTRATQDIDTTIRNFPLEAGHAEEILTKIIEIPLDDNMTFQIYDITDIMDEMDYSGLRVSMNAYLGRTRIPLKLDISTGDIITPAAVRYSLKLMFEDRFIHVWSYNLETVLAEKAESIISRGGLNTRMRDYYDLYILQKTDLQIDTEVLRDAIVSTSRKRKSEEKIVNYKEVLKEISDSTVMKAQWSTFAKKNSYVGEAEWDEVLHSVIHLFDRIFEKR